MIAGESAQHKAQHRRDIPPRESSTWRRIKAPSRDRWVCAVDLGQAHDSAAISIIHYTVKPLGTFEPNAIGKFWKEDRITRFDLLHLQRIPLPTDYVTQMHMVRELITREPLASVRLNVVFDETAVFTAKFCAGWWANFFKCCCGAADTPAYGNGPL